MVIAATVFYSFLGIIGILEGAVIGSSIALIVIYYGLWKMKREWMYVAVSYIIIGILINYFLIEQLYALEALDYGMLSAHVLFILWLLLNREIFHVTKPRYPIGKRLGIKLFYIELLSMLITVGLILYLHFFRDSNWLIISALWASWLPIFYFVIPKHFPK